MNSENKRLVNCLNKLIRRRLSMWQRKYPGEILGVHVDRKERGGRKRAEYSVVFHVRRKLKRLPPQRRLPEFIDVHVPGRNKRRVPTDVIATGHFRTSDGPICRPGLAVSVPNSSARGTVGPIMFRGNQPYIVTNMHVIGRKFLRRNKRRVRIPRARQELDVLVRVAGNRYRFASFARGVLDGELDVAVARIEYPDYVSRLFFGDTRITRVMSVSSIRERDKRLRVYLRRDRSSFVDKTDVVKVVDFPSPIGTINLLGLLRVTPRFSSPGDSGSGVITKSRRLVGIIVGADSKHSYIIPAESIVDGLGVTLNPQT